MPLVKPKDKEKREDFLERCMGDKTSVDDYPSRNQRFAVCNALYNRRNKKEDNSMDNIKDVAQAINSLSKVITNNVKAMDDEDKPKDKKQKDQY